MKKSISKRIRLIKSHRLYSSRELAEELGVHPRTVQQWQKQGLSSIDPDCKPFIFRGHEAKAFLTVRCKARKQKLQDGEFYCTKCRRPVSSLKKDVTLKAMGSRNRFHVKGKCVDCNTSLNRFMNLRSIQTGILGKIGKVADIRLYESQPANVNTDIRKE